MVKQSHEHNKRYVLSGATLNDIARGLESGASQAGGYHSYRTGQFPGANILPPFVQGIAVIVDRTDSDDGEGNCVQDTTARDGILAPCGSENIYWAQFRFWHADDQEWKLYDELVALDANAYWELSGDIELPDGTLKSSEASKQPTSGKGYGAIPRFVQGDVVPAFWAEQRGFLVPIVGPPADIPAVEFFSTSEEDIESADTNHVQIFFEVQQLDGDWVTKDILCVPEANCTSGSWRSTVTGFCTFLAESSAGGGPQVRLRAVTSAGMSASVLSKRLRLWGAGRNSVLNTSASPDLITEEGGTVLELDWELSTEIIGRYKDAPTFDHVGGGYFEVDYLDPIDAWLIGAMYEVCVSGKGCTSGGDTSFCPCVNAENIDEVFITVGGVTDDNPDALCACTDWNEKWQIRQPRNSQGESDDCKYVLQTDNVAGRPFPRHPEVAELPCEDGNSAQTYFEGNFSCSGDELVGFTLNIVVDGCLLLVAQWDEIGSGQPTAPDQITSPSSSCGGKYSRTTNRNVIGGFDPAPGGETAYGFPADGFPKYGPLQDNFAPNSMDPSLAGEPSCSAFEVGFRFSNADPEQSYLWNFTQGKVGGVDDAASDRVVALKFNDTLVFDILGNRWVLIAAAGNGGVNVTTFTLCELDSLIDPNGCEWAELTLSLSFSLKQSSSLAEAMSYNEGASSDFNAYKRPDSTFLGDALQPLVNAPFSQSDGSFTLDIRTHLIPGTTTTLIYQTARNHATQQVYERVGVQRGEDAATWDNWIHSTPETTYVQWKADEAEGKASTTRNNRPVVELNAGDEVYFSAFMPEEYDGYGFRNRVAWVSASDQTTGSCQLRVAFERMQEGIESVDLDNFATDQTLDDLIPDGNKLVISEKYFDDTEIDQIAAGDPFRIRVKRIASGDTMTGACQVYLVELKRQGVVDEETSTSSTSTASSNSVTSTSLSSQTTSLTESTSTWSSPSSKSSSSTSTLSSSCTSTQAEQSTSSTQAEQSSSSSTSTLSSSSTSTQSESSSTLSSSSTSTLSSSSTSSVIQQSSSTSSTSQVEQSSSCSTSTQVQESTTSAAAGPLLLGFDDGFDGGFGS